MRWGEVEKGKCQKEDIPEPEMNHAQVWPKELEQKLRHEHKLLQFEVEIFFLSATKNVQLSYISVYGSGGKRAKLRWILGRMNYRIKMNNYILPTWHKLVGTSVL